MREKTRTRILHAYNEDMRSKQQMGLVPEELDPALVTLLISSITIYPLLYAKVTRMITGHSPDDPEFQQKWSQFLRVIGERIFKMEPPGEPKQEQVPSPASR